MCVCVFFSGAGYETDVPEPVPGKPLPVRHAQTREALFDDGESINSRARAF